MASQVCSDAGAPVPCADHEVQGREENIGDLKVYVSGNDKSRGVVIVISDIFGYAVVNTRKFCDHLGAAGLLAVMPDFLREKVWDAATFPPADRSAFTTWKQKMDENRVIERDTEAVVAHFKRKGARKFGVVGFCWGGLQALSKLSTKPFAPATFSAGGSIHGAALTSELAQKLEVPVMVLPAGDDPSYEPLKEVLDTKPFGNKCVYHQFMNEKHGFCAARGDMSNPETAKAVQHARQLSAEFFKKTLL